MFFRVLLLLWWSATVVKLVAALPTEGRDQVAPEIVHTVHLVFSHHLDVGENTGQRVVADCLGFGTKAVQMYFDHFIPRAIRLAKEMRDGDDKFAYTIHPWIASLYVDCVPWYIPDGCPLNPGQLRCPSAEQVAEFDDAVRRGELLWADSPMNLDAGIVGEPGMFEGLMDIAGSLNERYNLSKKARVWSNIDVPGFVRSSIPALRRAGATALSICANVGEPNFGTRRVNHSTVPVDLVGNRNATMFRWYDPVSHEEILVLYHMAQHDNFWDIPLHSVFNTYGGFTRPDNMLITRSGVALASYIASDNSGPPLTTWEVKSVFRKVRHIFPKARVFSSTWDSFVGDISSEDIAALPRHSSEWGDQWLTGMATDPVRLSTYRALMRARASCFASGGCQLHDPVVRNFTRFAAKISEHTQGIQGGKWSPGSQSCSFHDFLHTPCPGFRHWSNDEFAKVHNVRSNVFPGADDSWLEARLFNTLAIDAVPASHPLSGPLQEELAALKPHLPNVPPPWVSDAPPAVKCRGLLSSTAHVNFTWAGSIESLSFGTGKTWSNLMDLRYITSHLPVKCLGVGCPSPVPGAWAPKLIGFWSDPEAQSHGDCVFTVQLAFNSTLHAIYGAPATVLVAYELNPESRKLKTTLTWQNKTSTRMPEAMTVFSRPLRRAKHRWTMNSLGEWVSLSNFTLGGEQYMHAVWSGIRYTRTEPASSTAGLWITSLDAGMVCPVLNKAADSSLTEDTAMQKSCFEYDIRSFDSENQQQVEEPMIQGLGINLHNNRMGISGFAQWYPFGVGSLYQKQDETAQFRFVIEERVDHTKVDTSVII